MLNFHLGSEAVSDIDNRMLAKNPFGAEMRANGGDFTEEIENYVNDRIGFRDQMILEYTLLNDRLFGKMVHPSYCYGQDGQVFFKMYDNVEYGDFHETFADMIKKIQDYCEERSVPFLFVLEPSKESILDEYLPKGVQRNDSWINMFLEALDKRGVHYIDNTVILQDKTDEGEMVFNQKFDAGHWNDLGAFYGTNMILSEVQKSFSGVHVNTYEELEISDKLETSLEVSEFPIHEWVPEISVPTEAENLTDNFVEEVEINSNHPVFGYYKNQQRINENAPKVLMFQGSHMNSYGKKYMINGFGEYIHIHNYQNIINFPYYFNIFQPEYVIFEVADRTLISEFFNYTNMEEMKLTPTLAYAKTIVTEIENINLDSDMILVKKGKTLTKLLWNGNDSSEEYIWIILDKDYDMRKNNDGIYELTVMNHIWEKYENNFIIVTQTGGNMQIYK